MKDGSRCNGLGCPSRQLQVLADQAGDLARALATVLDQPVGHQTMIDPPRAFQQAFKGHLPQQGVLEDLLLRIGKSRTLPLEDHFLGVQGGQRSRDSLCFALRAAGLRHGLIPELPAYHYSLLKD
jgi:hypothetical protein